MRCGPAGNVTMVLIGLQQVGITGLRDAFKEAEGSEFAQLTVEVAGDEARRAGSELAPAVDDALLDSLERRIAEQNYVPVSQRELYRRAIWREYLRYRGEDIRPFFSEVDVVVRGDAGDVRDRFVHLLGVVFGEFELRPVIDFVSVGGPTEFAGDTTFCDAGGAIRRLDEVPELVIDETVVVRGLPSRENFKAAVRKTISDW